ncbi:transcriptional regulator protein-like protein [Methanothermus fervidus DSM 2088]|uniref:Transcriptional regulator protein-like protein n=1 Tax=Methanothermus fervidus (strain ATCC 43054 / DSM 2088 / JCM 10308 / V24 S) TaxID=523846 RepID=E3GWF3_METFV|nr:hypothetical protein [Methanothermus fervidus]ADP77918.1 transcriptional regulator protein-like protein [Methanothermus fervidus DSM 2088]
MIPLVPTSKTEINKLEHVLVLGTLFRPEILKLIKDPRERITWVESLAVASGSIAREKAGYTVREIAEELGRTEQTIRKHVKGETKAGKLVRETYNMIKEGKLDMSELEDFLETTVRKEELESKLSKVKELDKKLEKLKKENEKLNTKLEKVREKLEEILEDIK